MTRLETFLTANGIKLAHLARESRVSRRQLGYLRSGRAEPTRPKMLAIRDACSRLLGRQVHLAALFDLGDMPVVVERWQGNLFAEEWFRRPIDDACDETGVVQWPDDYTAPDVDDTLNRCHDLTEQITSRVYDDMKDAIAEAFVRVANDVLARDRSR